MASGTEQSVPSPPIHVGVIGAGLAGLRCADLLDQYGFKVTIIEGRDRIGGRVHQEELPNGSSVDLGPNWIHGTKDNPMLDLAKETGTAIGHWDTRSYVFNQFGVLLPLEVSERYSTIMWDIIAEAFVYSHKHSAEIGSDETLWDFFGQRVQEKMPDTELDSPREREILVQMLEHWGAFVGSHVTRQSLKFFWLEECIEGENLFCAGTYRKILQTIAEPALEHAEIKYNTVVERVEYKTNPSDRVKVHTRNNQVLEFDDIVVTAPLGWLKCHADAFSPRLPDRLLKAIDSIGYGNLEKVYISFPAAFWRTPDDRGRKLQGFCQWVSPTYAPDTNPDRWNQEMIELASLTESTSHPTLLFYMYGEQSTYITEALREKSSSTKRDEFLYNFFRPYYSRLPHYDQSNPDCRPCGCLATDWLHDELAGYGSYGNFQVGLTEGDLDIRVMREGVPEGGLWLAGEHTAPFVALGTATGAYWSGQEVARRIAKAYGPIEDDDGSR